MRRIPQTISAEDFEKVLYATKQPHHRLAFALGFYQAMRISEIKGLGKRVSRCCHAGFKKDHEYNKWHEKKQILYCAKCNKRLTAQDIKRSTLEFQIKPLAKEDIYDNIIHLRHCKGQKDRNIPLSPQVEEILKEIPLPITISHRSLETAWKRIVKKVLNKDMTFHGLRHSGATHYLNEKKWNIRFVQEFLGHSSLDMTQRYTHVKPEQLLEVMRG